MLLSDRQKIAFTVEYFEKGLRTSYLLLLHVDIYVVVLSDFNSKNCSFLLAALYS